MDAVLRRAEMGVPLVWSRRRTVLPARFKPPRARTPCRRRVPMARADVRDAATRGNIVDAPREGRGARGVAGGDRTRPLGRRRARAVHRRGAVGGICCLRGIRAAGRLFSRLSGDARCDAILGGA